MSSAGSPHHRILECLLKRPVNLIADFFDRGFVSDNQCLAKVWLLPFPVDSLAGGPSEGIQCSVPLRIDPHKLQLFPASFHHILNAEIKFTAHDHCVWLSRQFVQEIEGHRVDFVVNVQAWATRLAVFAWSSKGAHHLIYFLWSFIMTSMKSSTVANCDQPSPRYLWL